MNVLRIDPSPVPQPPPTYNITGLTQEEAMYLMFVCEKSTYIAVDLSQIFKGQLPHMGPGKISVVLNTLYHVLRAAGVPHVKA